MRAVKKTLGMKMEPVPKKVAYFPVNKVNHQTLQKLKDKLALLKKGDEKADALLVGIDVNVASGRQGDSQLTQADLIGKMLQKKARELEIPLVTYAESAAMMHGMHLLSFGDHVLANETAFLGNFGFARNAFYLKDFVEDWHVKIRYVHHGENKVRFNPFEPIKQGDIDWLLKLYGTMITFMVDRQMDARAAKITDSEATRRYLEEGNFFFAKDAAKMGLIDQIVSPDAFFQEHFKGELYTIGELKSSIWEKLGLINREEYLASILDSLADEHLQAAEDALQSSTQMLEADPLTFAMQQGLLSPHLTRDFP